MHKRLFIGCEITSPWPHRWPPGKVIEPDSRHFTLLFLGEQVAQRVEELMEVMPLPSSPLGPMGYFSEVLFLPPQEPRVVAWKMEFFRHQEVLTYQKVLAEYFAKELDIQRYNRKSFLPHLTICRHPHERRKWKKHFTSLPYVITKMHLYETLHSSRYHSLWSHPFILPFVEMEHTADIAYKIRGESFAEIEEAALMALAFECPAIIPFIEPISKKESIDAVIADLNRILAEMDMAIGAPFKAVSYHGKVTEIGKNLWEWEMIVDV